MCQNRTRGFCLTNLKKHASNWPTLFPLSKPSIFQGGNGSTFSPRLLSESLESSKKLGFPGVVMANPPGNDAMGKGTFPSSKVPLGGDMLVPRRVVFEENPNLLPTYVFPKLSFLKAIDDWGILNHQPLVIRVCSRFQGYVGIIDKWLPSGKKVYADLQRHSWWCFRNLTKEAVEICRISRFFLFKEGFQQQIYKFQVPLKNWKFSSSNSAWFIDS